MLCRKLVEQLIGSGFHQPPNKSVCYSRPPSVWICGYFFIEWAIVMTLFDAWMQLPPFVVNWNRKGERASNRAYYVLIGYGRPIKCLYHLRAKFRELHLQHSDYMRFFFVRKFPKHQIKWSPKRGDFRYLTSIWIATLQFRRMKYLKIVYFK